MRTHLGNLLTSGLLGTCLAVSQAAHAAPIDALIKFDPSNSGTFTIVGVNEFDWQSSGDLVIKDTLPMAATYKAGLAGEGTTTSMAVWLINAVVGDSVTFNAYAHARLNDMTDIGGGSVSGLGGLSTDGGATGSYEVTAALALTETAVLIDTAPPTVLFTAISGDYSFFLDSSPDSNVATGAGFNDGIPFLSGHSVTVAGSSNFSNGSDLIRNSVTAQNTMIIDVDPPDGMQLVETTFDALLSPPGPTQAVVGPGGDIGLLPYQVQAGDVVMKADANTEFFSDVIPDCCVDIEKEINVDGVWHDHDLCADAPVVPAPHSGEYRLIVTNCGNTVLTSVQINDPTLGIVNVPITDLAPGETRTLTSGDIPALGTQEICLNAGEFPNTASITADCAEGPVPSVSDEDSSCLVCEEELGCRLTGGGVAADGTWDGTMTPLEDDEVNYYQFGGQAGANTALPPQPKGEWQHHQQKGLAGSFSFHAGTASAPAGTEVIEIRCSDPGGCTPSGNPPSPNKQLDFDCVGTFSNIGSGKSAPTWLIAAANVTAEGHGNQTFNGTFHYCEVNVDDLGEGPGPAEPDTADCPPEGFGEKGDPTVPANCDCPDFYRITIYDGVNAADVTFLPDGSIDPTTLNKTDVIYEVEGYLKAGNGLQLHSLTGFDTN